MGDLITSFLYALLKQWVALMSGIVSLSITIILRASGKEPRNKVFWSIAAFFILIAFFFAWTDEHVMRKQAQNELSAATDKSGPRLTCKIERVIIAEEADTRLAQVFVYLTVRNSGAPSIAEKYKLHIKTPDFEYSEESRDISREYTLPTEDKNKNVTILQKDALVKRTEQPIQGGGTMERGWLRFVMQLKEATPDFIRRPGIKYAVSLADVNGKACSADYVMPKNTHE